MSVGNFGLYMTFIYLFSTLMLTKAGKLMDKYSARWLLTVSSAILGLVLLTMSSFNAVWQFYLAGAVIGLTFAFLLYLSYPTMINRWFNVNIGFFYWFVQCGFGNWRYNFQCPWRIFNYQLWLAEYLPYLWWHSAFNCNSSAGFAFKKLSS